MTCSTSTRCIAAWCGWSTAHRCTAVLSPEAPRLLLETGARPDRLGQLISFGRRGAWHIWLGFDHILFLISLLLPAGLRRQNGRFGLLHGLGYAGVLLDLGLPRDALVVPLLAFNLGVELGQLAIVALFLPLAFLMRETALYPQLMVRAGSTAIAAVAGVWLIERLFDLRLL